MRWINHQATTVTLVYAGTGNLLATSLAWVGSTFPDLIELPFGKLVSHRTWSHWIWSYFSLFLIFMLASTAYNSRGFEYGNYFILGCLLHLSMDFLSPRGIPFGLTSFSERKGLGFYRPFETSEYLLALGIAILGILVAWWRGFYSIDYLTLEIQRAFLLLKLLGWRLVGGT